LLYDDVYVFIYWLFIVINYINLFVFDYEIEMKNKYNTDINICTNKSGPFIHETEHARYMQSSTVSVRKNWLLTSENGTWRFFWLLLFGSQSSPCLCLIMDESFQLCSCPLYISEMNNIWWCCLSCQTSSHRLFPLSRSSISILSMDLLRIDDIVGYRIWDKFSWCPQTSYGYFYFSIITLSANFHSTEDPLARVILPNKDSAFRCISASIRSSPLKIYIEMSATLFGRLKYILRCLLHYLVDSTAVLATFWSTFVGIPYFFLMARQSQGQN
jgi:hypothetical protein